MASDGGPRDAEAVPLPVLVLSQLGVAGGETLASR